MSNNYGSGVSRVLDPTARQFLDVIWQEGKPPTDAELNLIADIANSSLQTLSIRNCPSGWLGNETNSGSDFQTSSTYSNWFTFGRQYTTSERASMMWAVVNGWLIPVSGTRTGAPPGSPNDTTTTNVIALDPPPSSAGDFRTDSVFLEVWMARLPPNPSTQNKPASSAIWRYGNVEGGFSFLADDLVDPALGFETTQRVQLQYRIRVVKGLTALSSYPDGFDPSVKAQGTLSAVPVTGFSFSNMRETLGDPGLWRAGDGTANALGTVDGYVYAIPLCAVFRRNAAAWTGDPTQNLNGGFNRNILAVDRTGIKTYTATPTLSAQMSATATTLTLTTTTGISLPLAPSVPVAIKIGDEYMTYTSIDANTSTILGITRAQYGSFADLHASGSVVQAVSGRPDGLFSDQIARTDILDLRHAVNANGFDYQTLLQNNLDKLLRGQLRANWKRTGAGPQGTFLTYQDKIVSAGGSVGLGITRLDGPDDIRQVFSDAATVQPVEVVVQANASGLPANVSVGGSLGTLLVNQTSRVAPSLFSQTDVLVIPVATLKAGLPAGSTDQVRFVNDGLSTAVTIRVDGSDTPVDPSAYTVTPAFPGPSDDLTITLNAGFPGSGSSTGNQLYITTTVMYGPGRGLSRRPDSLHSIAFTAPNTELMLQQSSIPFGNVPTRVAWAPMWARFRNDTYHNALPVTAEAYADLGSKSVMLTPFRRIVWPTEFRSMDGTAMNAGTSSIVSSSVGVSNNTTTFTDASKNFTGSGVVAGDVLQVTAPGGAVGNYAIVSAGTTTLVTTDAVPTANPVTYTIAHAGLMPLYKTDGLTPKWATTDPLELFSGVTDPTAATRNIYVTFPRHMIPNWGEYRVPLRRDPSAGPTGIFPEGVNYMLLSGKGNSTFTAGDRNYVPYGNAGYSYAAFSTIDLVSTLPATYNTLLTSYAGGNFAGMRQFTDARSLGRQGLELPPFYGIARLFGVYEANDYAANGSAFAPTTRSQTGSVSAAKNLLRQDFQGPTFWVEIDEDGDSTFILNADTLDLTQSTNFPIASFASGDYVIEASIFGFDRDSFDITQPFRLVMTRPTDPATMRTDAANTVTRSLNINAVCTGPTGVLPGPCASSDNIVINYSRTPYQGDAFGSQTSYVDTAYNEGPLQSATAYQVVSTNLVLDSLTRPNQKPLEVLASLGFSTTLGTGRYSGDSVNGTSIDFRNVGYEDPASYPPVSSVAARPVTLFGSFATDDGVDVPTEYLGCTDRLPLGALMRDKDFRGQRLNTSLGGILVYNPIKNTASLVSNLSVNSSYEQSEVNLSTSSLASGIPGEMVVHVDGEQGNYALLVNYRTARGGSAFNATGPNAGGELGGLDDMVVQAASGHTNVLTGRAFLVRNEVTTSGSTEVSPGDELMMLIVTTAQRMTDTDVRPNYFSVGTNGLFEGYSAADLYRIEGRPILANNVHMSVDPSTIALSPKGY